MADDAKAELILVRTFKAPPPPASHRLVPVEDADRDAAAWAELEDSDGQ